MARVTPPQLIRYASQRRARRWGGVNARAVLVAVLLVLPLPVLAQSPDATGSGSSATAPSATAPSASADTTATAPSATAPPATASSATAPSVPAASAPATTLPATTRAADLSPEAAVEQAKAYVDGLTNGDARKTVRAIWSFESLAASIFGEDLAKLSPADRASVVKMFADYFEQIVSSDAYRKVMRETAVSDYKAEPVPGDARQVRVSFKITINGEAIPNEVVLKVVDEQWKIVDAGPQGRLLAPSLRNAYKATIPPGEPGDPLKFIQKMLENVPK